MINKSYIIFLLIFVSCKNDAAQKETEALYQTIEALSNLDDKRDYLEAMYKDLVKVRKASDHAMSIFGRNSEEHLARKKELDQNRNWQYKKLDVYLNTHGYPSIMKLGGMAAYAPYFITQNMPDIESRKKNFTYLYDAYVFGDITVDLFYDYLASLYIMEKKEAYLYDPNIETRRHIEKIMAALNLE